MLADPMRRAMELQYLAFLVIRQVLLLRLSPLQRRMAFEDHAAMQFALLRHIMTNRMGDPGNLFVSASNNQNFTAWIN